MFPRPGRVVSHLSSGGHRLYHVLTCSVTVVVLLHTYHIHSVFKMDQVELFLQGIISNVTLGGDTLVDWQMFPLNFEKLFEMPGLDNKLR